MKITPFYLIAGLFMLISCGKEGYHSKHGIDKNQAHGNNIASPKYLPANIKEQLRQNTAFNQDWNQTNLKMLPGTGIWIKFYHKTILNSARLKAKNGKLTALNIKINGQYLISAKDPLSKLESIYKAQMNMPLKKSYHISLKARVLYFDQNQKIKDEIEFKDDIYLTLNSRTTKIGEVVHELVFTSVLNFDEQKNELTWKLDSIDF